MKKTQYIILGMTIGIAFVAGYAVYSTFDDAVVIMEPNQPAFVALSDVANISYVIDGQPVLLKDGRAEREVAPGSATKDIFTIFGEPVFGDIDGDSDVDAIMYLTRDSGGSGIFYYVIVATKDGDMYKGTNAMFLGDRIAPQNIVLEDGRAVANFAERKAGEPFTTPPSEGKSVWIHLDVATNEIGELVPDFEGEANPAQMSVGMKTWVWQYTTYANTPRVTPKKIGAFSLTFHKDGVITVTTDCNTSGGTYAIRGDNLSFEKMVSTEMFCEGSQGSEFLSMLNDVSAHHFTGKGELVLTLDASKGEVILR